MHSCHYTRIKIKKIHILAISVCYSYYLEIKEDKRQASIVILSSADIVLDLFALFPQSALTKISA